MASDLDVESLEGSVDFSKSPDAKSGGFEASSSLPLPSRATEGSPVEEIKDNLSNAKDSQPDAAGIPPAGVEKFLSPRDALVSPSVPSRHAPLPSVRPRSVPPLKPVVLPSRKKDPILEESVSPEPTENKLIGGASARMSTEGERANASGEASPDGSARSSGSYRAKKPAPIQLPQAHRPPPSPVPISAGGTPEDPGAKGSGVGGGASTRSLSGHRSVRSHLSDENEGGPGREDTGAGVGGGAGSAAGRNSRKDREARRLERRASRANSEMESEPRDTAKHSASPEKDRDGEGKANTGDDGIPAPESDEDKTTDHGHGRVSRNEKPSDGGDVFEESSEDDDVANGEKRKGKLKNEALQPGLEPEEESAKDRKSKPADDSDHNNNNDDDRIDNDDQSDVAPSRELPPPPKKRLSFFSRQKKEKLDPKGNSASVPATKSGRFSFFRKKQAAATSSSDPDSKDSNKLGETTPADPQSKEPREPSLSPPMPSESPRPRVGRSESERSISEEKNGTDKGAAMRRWQSMDMSGSGRIVTPRESAKEIMPGVPLQFQNSVLARRQGATRLEDLMLGGLDETGLYLQDYVPILPPADIPKVVTPPGVRTVDLISFGASAATGVPMFDMTGGSFEIVERKLRTCLVDARCKVLWGSQSVIPVESVGANAKQKNERWKFSSNEESDIILRMNDCPSHVRLYIELTVSVKVGQKTPVHTSHSGSFLHRPSGIEETSGGKKIVELVCGHTFVGIADVFRGLQQKKQIILTLFNGSLVVPVHVAAEAPKGPVKKSFFQRNPEDMKLVLRSGITPKLGPLTVSMVPWGVAMHTAFAVSLACFHMCLRAHHNAHASGHGAAYAGPIYSVALSLMPQLVAHPDVVAAVSKAVTLRLPSKTDPSTLDEAVVKVFEACVKQMSIVTKILNLQPKAKTSARGGSGQLPRAKTIDAFKKPEGIAQLVRKPQVLQTSYLFEPFDVSETAYDTNDRLWAPVDETNKLEAFWMGVPAETPHPSQMPQMSGLHRPGPLSASGSSSLVREGR